MRLQVKTDFEDVKRNLRQMPGLVGDRVIQQALLAAGRVALKELRRPGFAFNDRTGDLRRSYRVRAVNERIGGRSQGRGRRGRTGGIRLLYARILGGGPGARHASLLEFGTRYIASRAPLRKAVVTTAAQQIVAARSAAVRAWARLSLQLRTGRVSRVVRRASIAFD